MIINVLFALTKCRWMHHRLFSLQSAIIPSTSAALHSGKIRHVLCVDLIIQVSTKRSVDVTFVSIQLEITCALFVELFRAQKVHHHHMI
mmetsp:Transcript_31500/g.63548  ORF Transcript_31500/g.63548 Transcript_31500/m.63548 type:complete len:89 (+) Transcript_31500:1111-1377(+)